MIDPNELSKDEADLTISLEGEELSEAEQNSVSGGGVYGDGDGDGS